MYTDAVTTKINRRLLRNLKLVLPCDPCVRLLGIYLKEFKSADQRDVITIAKLWIQQPIYSSTNEQIKKIKCIYIARQFCSMIKKMPFAEK